MKTCDYCGKENEERLAFCFECGTALSALEDSPPEKASPPTDTWRTLNAKTATIILLATLAVDIFGGVAIGIAEIMKASAHEHGNPIAFGVVDKFMPAIAIAIRVLGGFTTILMAIVLVPNSLKDTSPNGAAWVRGRWIDIVNGLLIGLVIRACVVGATRLLTAPVSYKDVGPWMRMAFEPGLPGIVWDMVAVLLAPPVEEILFRGVLYGGYRKSFGPGWAAILTTAIFVLMHLPNIMRFPPAIVGLTALAIAALYCRLRSKAIGPAIAVHIGYNAFRLMIR